MPYKWVDPDVFFEYKGIEIYHSYKDGWYIDVFNFRYSTDILENTGDTVDYEFDVRDLPNPDNLDLNHGIDNHETIIKGAIDKKLLLLPEGVKYEF